MIQQQQVARSRVTLLLGPSVVAKKSTEGRRNFKKSGFPCFPSFPFRLCARQLPKPPSVCSNPRLPSGCKLEPFRGLAAQLAPTTPTPPVPGGKPMEERGGGCSVGGSGFVRWQLETLRHNQDAHSRPSPSPPPSTSPGRSLPCICAPHAIIGSLRVVVALRQDGVLFLGFRLDREDARPSGCWLTGAHVAHRAPPGDSWMLG